MPTSFASSASSASRRPSAAKVFPISDWKPHTNLKQRAAALCVAFALGCAAQGAAFAQDVAQSAVPATAQAASQPASQPAQAASASAAQQPAALPLPPSELYGQLYRDVELAQVFPDSKTFADMTPNEAPARIVEEYEMWRAQHAGITDADARKTALRQFVGQHFSEAKLATDRYVSDPNQDVASHIDTLWNVLRRNPDAGQQTYSSLLPLPNPYVVPGGRFNEIYYWDSYFIMLGLEASGRHDLTRDTLDNFAALIDRYGHIPNGNRSYYLSRSQPPFFAQMVALVAQRDGDAVYVRYLPELRKEYDYWMAGADTLKPGEAAQHVVRLADGTLLNRYWDARDTPRDESYREDVLTAQAAPQREAADLWRNLRAGGETGWDFSSRWFADNRTLATIDITSLVPVDLNSLLVDLERTLAKAYGLKGDAAQAEAMSQRAQQRSAAIGRVLWDPKLHAFGDYDFVHHTLTHRLTAATVYPLYAGVATRAQARQVAAAVRAGLLRPGGLATTQVSSGQQWDEPNGWAPLQYLAIAGLRRYGENALAQTIATRWIATNLVYYRRTFKLVEKYDVSAAAAKASSAGGGEYPLQDGFGWTNGVLRVLLAMYPHTEGTTIPAR
ncbi:alpha,alpha-trehalase TreF [Paraburkholderia sp. J94]|uniref:alpha,alpha-trehalase TreF n=1 Tax=Paraburkholderia sp. J94 TaxID=2805441 RepID=UPI0039EEB9CF